MRQFPQPMMYGSFTKGTVPPHRLYSLIAISPFQTTFADCLPRPTRPPLARSPDFRRACGTMQSSDDSPRIRSHFPLRVIGAVIPVPPGNVTSPPGVTHRSSVPCRSHTPWFDGWIRTPSPKYSRLDLAPSLADRFVRGVAPLTTARYCSSSPSDSTSRWTPCPPVVSRQCPDLAPVLAVSVVSNSVPV